MTGQTLGVFLKGYPRLSETFIAQEFLELERAGFTIEIVSLRRPTDIHRHPVHEEISAPVHYLPEYVHDEPLRVFSAWRKARQLPGYRAAFRQFWRDFWRDPTRNRARRFAQGLVIAAEYGARFSWLYVHYLHTPASAVRYGATMTGKPFSISAHAKDIWTIEQWEKAEKLHQAEWCVTCTASGAEHLAALVPASGKVHLVHHGIDLARFPSPPRSKRHANGADANDPVRLVTVCRAVGKKGLDTLIHSLAALPDDLNWRWTHIGGGEQHAAMVELAQKCGLGDRVQFLGARPQQDVIAAYRASDLFVLPCRITKSGDRDGLPNVFVEAQSQRLAILTTPISGIPELITDRVNGVFVEPDDQPALTNALLELVRDPALRGNLGDAGHDIARGKFDHLTTIHKLVALFDQHAPGLRNSATIKQATR